MAIFLHKEMLAVEFGCNRNKPLKQLQDGIFRGIGFLGVMANHLDAAIDQDDGENVDHPVEALDQGDSCEDQNRTHDQRSQDAPEKNPMLIHRRNTEILKNQGKDENVVDAQRYLNQVAGQKFQASL